jgi:hypothetical protein
MKKQFKIRRANPGFIAIDLIEDGKTVGSSLLPDYESNRESISKHLEKKGYTEYEKTNNPN